MVLRWSPALDFYGKIDTILKPTVIVHAQKKMSPQDDLEANIKRHLLDLSLQPKVPHPFFGYVYNRIYGHEVNRDGFNDSIDFQELKRNDPSLFIIGIFGGSVAKNFAKWKKREQKKGNDRISELLMREFPERFKNKKILFLNFAISGGKQPQQFIISSFYSNKLHMAMTIDGYNDMKAPISLEFPDYYPVYSQLFYSLNPARNKYIDELYELMSQQIYLAEKARDSWIFFRSWTVRYMWFVYNLQIQRKINEAHTTYRNSWDLKAPYHKGQSFSDAENLVSALNRWEEFSIKQSTLLFSEGVDHFHFVQPNQHVLNTKPLSAEEKEKYMDASRVHEITAGYANLLSRLSHMRNKNRVNVYDLTRAFSNTTETVYLDDCCHLNERGHEILEISIADKIIKSLKIRQRVH